MESFACARKSKKTVTSSWVRMHSFCTLLHRNLRLELYVCPSISSPVRVANLPSIIMSMTALEILGGTVANAECGCQASKYRSHGRALLDSALLRPSARLIHLLLLCQRLMSIDMQWRTVQDFRPMANSAGCRRNCSIGHPWMCNIMCKYGKDMFDTS